MSPGLSGKTYICLVLINLHVNDWTYPSNDLGLMDRLASDLSCWFWQWMILSDVLYGF